jgi:peptide/nickel transport system substrate-binding protein
MCPTRIEPIRHPILGAGVDDGRGGDACVARLYDEGMRIGNLAAGDASVPSSPHRPPPPLHLAFILLLFLLLVACDTSAPPATPVSSPLLGPYRGTQPASRTRQGTLELADRQFPDAVNPLFAASPADLEVSAALWGAPVVFDNHFHAQPDELTEVPLPENGDVRDQGMTIMMHLRHDLRWSDGQPILARDFLYWWQLNQNPDTGAITTTGYDQIASISTPDDFTVVLHMKHPYGPYLSSLPLAAPYHAWSRLRPLDLQNDQAVYLTPDVTSGPYRLASFVNGQSYGLVPNPYYASTTFHGPYLAHLGFRAYGTTGAMLAAMRAGQVDVAAGYMEDELASLGNLPPAMRLLETPAASYEHLDFNLSRPFFQDARVRRAIQLAIDACGIVRQILHAPDCSRVASQVEPLPSLYFDPTIAASAFDPAAARRLLAQAGWLPGSGGLLARQGQPFVVRLVTTSDNPIRAAVAQTIRRDLLTVGIQARISTYSLGDFFAVYSRGGVLATGAFDLAMFGYQDSPEPDDEFNVFHSSQIPSASQPDLGNYGRVSDPVIDAALTAGRNSVPFAQRLKAYHTFLERLAAQVYLIPLYTGVNILILSSRVRNILPNPNVYANTWNIADWWVAV